MCAQPMANIDGQPVYCCWAMEKAHRLFLMSSTYTERKTTKLKALTRVLN